MGLISRVSSRTYREAMKPFIEVALRVGRATALGLRKSFSEEYAKGIHKIDTYREQRLEEKLKEHEREKNEGEKKPSGAAAAFQRPTIDLAEAKQILNIEHISPEMSRDEVLSIQTSYDKMYAANKWINSKRATPTYLQSRIYRAKERVDKELVRHKLLDGLSSDNGKNKKT